MPLITSIDITLFNSLKRLTCLNLECRHLLNLPEGLFLGLNNLKILNLTLDSNAKLKRDHFNGLENLESLKLSGPILDENFDSLINLK